MITSLTILLIAVGASYAWTLARDRLRALPRGEERDEILLELPWDAEGDPSL